MNTRSRVICLLILLFTFNVILSACFYNPMQLKDKEKFESYSEKILSQASTDISLKVGEINNILTDISLSEPLQSSINCTDAFDELVSSKSIVDMLSEKYIDLPFINSICISHINGRFDSLDKASKYDYIGLVNSIEVKDDGEVQWNITKLNGVDYIAASKKAFSLETGEEIGNIYILVTDSYLKDVLTSITHGDKASVFLMDINGVVLSSTDQVIPSSQKFENDGIVKRIVSSSSKKKNNYFVQNENLVLYEKINGVDWFIVVIISIENIQKFDI